MTTTPRTDAITQDPTLDADNEALSLAALSRRLERELAASRAECERLREALEAVMPQLEGCDCIYSDRDAPLCPCRAAWAALQAKE